MTAAVPQPLDAGQKLARMRERLRLAREANSKLPPLTYEQALAQVQRHQAAMSAQSAAKPNAMPSMK